MGLVAGVAGASGYAGGELLRLLAAHPHIQLGPLAAGSAAGRDVAEVHPHLVTLAGRTFQDTSAEVLAGADIVFLALPHGQSAELAAQLDPAQPVVDLGADHRLARAQDWTRYYPGEHPGRWPYGLPELPGAREQLAGARRVAGPGCYPTAVLLALAPLLAAGVAQGEDVVVTAASGVSGSGRTPTASLLAAEVMGDATAYKVGRHQHTPEIVQQLGEVTGTAVGLSFTTVLAPMSRGLLASCTARLAPGTSQEQVHQVLAQAYRHEPFVHLLPAGRWPRTSATLGSNSCHVQATVDHEAGRVVAVSALDNLGKGAAGQALQCANLMLGLPETAGLSALGVAP